MYANMIPVKEFPSIGQEDRIEGKEVRMTKWKSLALLVAFVLMSCGPESTGRKNGGGGQSEDGGLQASETVSLTLISPSYTEKYDSEGVMVERTDFRYAFQEIYPSYVTRDAEGNTLESLETSLDSEDRLLQTSMSVFQGNREQRIDVVYTRDENGDVTQIDRVTNGLRSSTQITLENGQEVSSEVFNGEGTLVSTREIDWSKSQITLESFDAEGEATRTFETEYLRIAMEQGLLKTFFPVTHDWKYYAPEKGRTQLKGQCDSGQAVVSCEQELFVGSDQDADEVTSSRLRLIQFDNGVYKYHEVVPVEVDKKSYSQRKLVTTQSETARYGEKYRLEERSLKDQEVGDAEVKVVTTYSYNEDGSVNYVEEFRNDVFESRTEYSYE